ncbi:MAG: hypothetical protein R8M45_02185, partial [Ghiorsea sp.]
LALGAGASIVNGFAESGANKKRQGIVNQGLQAQQGFKTNINDATNQTVNRLGDVGQAAAGRTAAVGNAIGEMPTVNRQGSGRDYQIAQGRMALSNAQRKGQLAQALGGQQGFQQTQFNDGMQRGMLSSQLGDINRQSQQQLFNDSQRLNAVRPNQALQFLSEGLNLGSAIAGVA